MSWISCSTARFGGSPPTSINKLVYLPSNSFSLLSSALHDNVMLEAFTSFSTGLSHVGKHPARRPLSWRWRFFSLLLELILLGVAT